MQLKSRKLVDLILSQAAPLLSSSVMTLASAVILGTAGRGELALVLAGSGLLGSALFFSLHVGIVRSYKTNNLSAVRTGWTFAAFLSAFVLAAGLALFAFGSTINIGLFNRDNLLLIITGAALLLLNLVVLRTVQGLGHARRFRNGWFLQSVIFPALGIPVALLTHSPAWVATTWFLALVVSTCYTALGLKTELLRRERHTGVAEIIKMSSAAHVGTVGQQLLFRGDVLVLGLFVSASAMGVYSIAMPIAGLVWVASEALSLLAFESGDQSTSQRVQQRRSLVKMNLVVGSAGAAVIGAASWFLLPSLFPQYADAVPLILLLLPGVVVQGWARICLSSINTTGALWAPATIGIVSAALSFLYVPFVAEWGTTGAAIGSTVIYCLQTLVVAAVTKRNDARVQRLESKVEGK